MSKENIHIDDLFKPLKGYKHPVEGGFAEINDKLHDEAWKDQFDGYEHAVTDIPPFSALPMAKSDKAFGFKAAGKYTLIIGIIALLSFGGYTAYNSITKNQKQATETASNQNIPSLQDKPVAILDPSTTDNPNEIDPNTPAQISSTKGTNANGTFNESASGEHASTSGIGSKNRNTRSPYIEKGSLDAKPETNTNPGATKSSTSPKPKAKRKPAADPAIDPTVDPENEGSDGTPITPQKKPTNHSNPSVNQNKGVRIVQADPDPLIKSETNGNNPDVNNFNPASKVPEENWFSGQRSINPFAAAAISAQSLNKFNRNKFLPKPRISYYAQLGLGFLSPTSPFANATPTNGLTYQAHFGIQYARFSFYSGLEKSNYTYTTTLRNIQLYDSFPHLGPGGDTIGYFKKNFRDTTINQNNSSRVVINSIPLHFQFKALQLDKMNVQFGTGLNINLINTKELWYKDNNNYLVNYGGSNTNTAKINLGLSLLARVGYRITPLTEIYGRLNIREAGNIINSNNPALKPSGAQLDFGIRYHLK